VIKLRCMGTHHMVLKGLTVVACHFVHVGSTKY
jgi:hypothetical protein